MDITKAEIHIKAKACRVLVDNIQHFLSVDHFDDEAHNQALLRLDAISMMFEDILRQVEVLEEETELETQARNYNPYYNRVSIFPKEGGRPNRSGIKSEN